MRPFCVLFRTDDQSEAVLNKKPTPKRQILNLVISYEFYFTTNPYNHRNHMQPGLHQPIFGFWLISAQAFCSELKNKLYKPSEQRERHKLSEAV